MEIAKPKKYVVHLSKCGLDSFSVSYKKLEDTNAIKLARIIVSCMGRNFAGQNSSYFQYQLACSILHDLDFKKEDLIKHIENFKIDEFDFLKEDEKELKNMEIK